MGVNHNELANNQWLQVVEAKKAWRGPPPKDGGTVGRFVERYRKMGIEIEVVPGKERKQEPVWCDWAPFGMCLNGECLHRQTMGEQTRGPCPDTQEKQGVNK